jgi:hypothetical protein
MCTYIHTYIHPSTYNAHHHPSKEFLVMEARLSSFSHSSSMERDLIVSFVYILVVIVVVVGVGSGWSLVLAGRDDVSSTDESQSISQSVVSRRKIESSQSVLKIDPLGRKKAVRMTCPT